MIEDDFHRSILESDILKRLNNLGNDNIIKSEAFYQSKSQQTTQLVMEALNGMTLDQFLTFQTSSEKPSGSSASFLSNQEESKESVQMSPEKVGRVKR